jgi:hypothetical protein
LTEKVAGGLAGSASPDWIITGVLIFQRNTWGLWLGVAFASTTVFRHVRLPAVGDHGADN